jgi:hypothetical protein
VFTRKYFEDGCLCIKNGKIDKQAVSVADDDAANYYEASCKCSRNYKHLEK